MLRRPGLLAEATIGGVLSHATHSRHIFPGRPPAAAGGLRSQYPDLVLGPSAGNPVTSCDGPQLPCSSRAAPYSLTGPHRAYRASLTGPRRRKHEGASSRRHGGRLCRSSRLAPAGRGRWRGETLCGGSAAFPLLVRNLSWRRARARARARSGLGLGLGLGQG